MRRDVARAARWIQLGMIASLAVGSAGYAQEFTGNREFRTNAFALGGASKTPDASAGVSGTSGAASVSIPIAVPPGPGGLAPNLRLEYSSDRGDGPFGLGWSLPLGEIRCTARFGVPEYANCTAFELDGQLLVGPDTRPGMEGRYHTRVESFNKIRRLGAGASGYWEVTLPGGTRHLYGETPNSRIGSDGLDTPASAVTARWLLSEIADIHGNEIAIHYDRRDTGIAYPETISYASGAREITFVYEERPDEILDFPGGIPRNITLRLREIAIESAGEIFSRRLITYSAPGDHPTHRSRIASTQLFGRGCHEPGPNCAALPAQRFAYTDATAEAGHPHWADAPSGHWQAGIFVKTGAETSSDDLGRRLADVNGDGRPDLLVSYCSDALEPCADAEGPVVYINDGSGWVRDEGWTNSFASLRFEAPTITVHSAPYDAYYRRICDATFGTVTRRVSFAAGEPDWLPIFSSDGDAQTYTPWPAWQLVDVNGDGRADLVNSTGTAAARQYDCDGVRVTGEFSDIYQLVKGPRSQKIFLNNGSGWDPAPEEMAASLPIFQEQIIVKHVRDARHFATRSSDCDGVGLLGGWVGSRYCMIWKDYRPQFVELNGDGLADIVALKSDLYDQTLWMDHFDRAEFIGAPDTAAWIQQAGGGGWAPARDFDLPFPHIRYSLLELPSYSRFGVGGLQAYDFGVYFVDLNRDGLTDVVKDAWYSEPMAVLINTGTGWCNDMGTLMAADCDRDTSHSRYQPPIAFNEYSWDEFRSAPISKSAQLAFVDLNGDGWLDLLQGKDGLSGNPDVLRAWLHDPGASAADAAGKASVWIEQSDVFKPPTPFYPGTQFPDLDGDGLADILHGWRLYGDGPDWIADAAYLSSGRAGDLLASVDNGRGGITSFSYRSAASQRDEAMEVAAESHAAALGDADTRSEAVTLFTTKPVVAEQTVSGVGIAAGVTSRYQYARPRFDPVANLQLGFGLMKTTRPDRSRVDVFRYQRGGLAGRPSAQEIFDEHGILVHRSLQTWEVAPEPARIPGAMQGVEVVRRLQQVSFNVYAGESGAMQMRRFFYDDAYGYNFVASIADDRETGSLLTSFTPEEPADQAKWIIGLVREMKQLSGGISHSREVYAYTESGQLASRSRDIGLRDGTAASDVATTSWTYDAYGNVTRQLETRGRDAAGALLPASAVEFCYDGDGGAGSWCPSLPAGIPATHSLRVAIKDPVGGVVEFEPDWASGATRQINRFTASGSFRNAVTIVRDGFGRDTQKLFRGANFSGDAAAVQLTETVFHDAAVEGSPAYVEEFQFTDPMGGRPIRTARYQDGFGNLLRTVEETPSGYRGTAVFRDPVSRTLRSVGPIACDRLDPACGGLALMGEPSTELELDAIGRVVRNATPDGQVTTAYSRAQRAQPVGNGIHHVFDAVDVVNANRQMTRQLMDGDRIVWVDECRDTGCYNRPDSSFYRYEPTGEISTIYDALAASTGDHASPARFLRYHYDTLGRVVRTDEPNSGSSFTGYDHQGNLTSVTNVRGMTTRTDYDPLGRVVSIDRPAGVGEWDLYFSYDPISRKRKSVTTPDSDYSDTWEYDDFGQLKRQTRSYYDKLVMEFEYDLLGRPIRIDYPSNHSSASYVYEGAYLKQVCRADDFCADASAKLLISEVLYDGLGRRSDITTPDGTLHREYYALADDPAGRSLDSLKRLAITAGAAAGALDFGYRYDAVGNVTAIDDHSTTYDASASYTYDARNRLASWTDAENVTSWYTYDALGNLEGHAVSSVGGSNQAFDLTTRPHRVSRNRSGEQYAYDPDGNLKMRGSAFFVYNSANQLVCTGRSEGACDGPGYRYDADGQLLWDGAAGQQLMGELFRWQAQGFVAHSSLFAFGEKIAELKQERVRLRAVGSLARMLEIPKEPVLWMTGCAGLFLLIALFGWISAAPAFCEASGSVAVALALTGLVAITPPAWGIGGRSRGTQTTLRVFFRDHLGSAVYVTGPNLRQAYEPFGKAILALTGSRAEFTSKPYHRAIGLYAFGARWYDAEAGRFAGVDPLLARPMDPEELNAYGYTLNDPVNRIDPTGSFTMCTPSGRVCFGDGGRRYHSNAPGGFLPFALNWTTLATGPVSEGLGWTSAYSGPIDEFVVTDHDGYPWVYRTFQPVNEPLQTAARGRISDLIYVTGHRVRGFGPYHLAIEGRFANGDPMTLSAQRSDGLLRSDLNRPGDTPANNVTIAVLAPPDGVSRRGYFAELQAADAAYCDCLDYDLFPEALPGTGYNSNSYILGIIGATGGRASRDLSIYYGGATPVPRRQFLRGGVRR